MPFSTSFNGNGTIGLPVHSRPHTTNRELLRRLPDADRYRFHGLLTIAELQQGDEIPVADLLREAESRIEAFDGDVHAVIGFFDLPVSTMVPLLCRRFGLRGPSLESVLRCEHKYWSRLVQRDVIDEYPPFALVDLEEPRLPDEVGYPCWIKPVKSFSSKLAFEVTDDQEFDAAIVELRNGIGRVGEPFEQADLPPEQDAEDVLAWLAGRPWCDGRTGMMGISWGGFAALQVAARRPPSLGAICVASFTDDRFADDMHYMRGCLLSDNLAESGTMFAYSTCPPDPALTGDRWRQMWLDRLDAARPWVAEWLHRHRVPPPRDTRRVRGPHAGVLPQLDPLGPERPRVSTPGAGTPLP